MLKMGFTQKNFGMFVGASILVFAATSLAKSASSQQFFYTTATEKLAITLPNSKTRDCGDDDCHYVAKYQLLSNAGKILNQGQFVGCAIEGYPDVVTFVKTLGVINVTPIKNGFAIHYMAACATQPIWGLEVITSACRASAPATDDSGGYINIGKDPNKILFGYLKGFGAEREVTNAYLTLKGQKIIYDSPFPKDVDAVDKPEIICK